MPIYWRIDRSNCCMVHSPTRGSPIDSSRPPFSWRLRSPCNAIPMVFPVHITIPSDLPRYRRPCRPLRLHFPLFVAQIPAYNESIAALSNSAQLRSLTTAKYNTGLISHRPFPWNSTKSTRRGNEVKRCGQFTREVGSICNRRSASDVRLSETPSTCTPLCCDRAYSRQRLQS
jgi:hypothetical protein